MHQAAAQGSAPSSLLVIQNPVAGGRHPERIRRKIESALKERRVTYRLEQTRGRGHAEELAAAAVESGMSRVLVAGGDGTVMEAVSALVSSGTVLGLIPVGTGNQLAANLGVPSRIGPAIEVATAAPEKRIDVGMIDGQPFTCMAGAGFDAAVIGPDLRLKKRVGYLAYVYAALAAGLSPKPSTLNLTIDGERISERGVGVEVANLPGLRPPGLPWPVKIVPDGRLDDGLLDICVIGADSTTSLVSVVTSILVGRPHRNPRLRYWRGREVHVEANPPLRVQADGELFGTTPFSATIRRQVLAVAVPNSRAEPADG